MSDKTIFEKRAVMILMVITFLITSCGSSGGGDGGASYNYIITTSSGDGGEISPGGSVQVDFGSDQTFDITRWSGYYVADVVVDSTSVGAVGTYTFTNVTADHTISATFLPSDTEGPEISFRCPKPEATRVGSAPSVSFNISDGGWGVNETLITSAIFTLKDSDGNLVDGTFAYSGGAVTYSDITLTDGVYTAAVTGLQDKGGNTASSYSWDFTAQPDLAASADHTGFPVCPRTGRRVRE